jgi:predicted GIY-YIG superfamily endonuclease
MSKWWLYICEKTERLYVGITTDLDNRLRQHGNPLLLYKEGPLTREEAVLLGRKIKDWRRAKKLQLIANGPLK